MPSDCQTNRLDIGCVLMGPGAHKLCHSPFRNCCGMLSSLGESYRNVSDMKNWLIEVESQKKDREGLER
jgi:hypothetical protein